MGLGIRDVLAQPARRPELKRVLVHEAVHLIQWQQAVQQAQTMVAKYRREFEAYWVSGEFAQIGNANRRAEAIRTHIAGANAADANTVYVDLRDWYWGVAPVPATPAERRTIDDMRIGTVAGLAWWHTNVHIRKLLDPRNGFGGVNGTDEERLEEWNKLGFFEKRRALADPALPPRLRATMSTPGSAFARAVGA